MCCDRCGEVCQRAQDAEAKLAEYEAAVKYPGDDQRHQGATVATQLVHAQHMRERAEAQLDSVLKQLVAARVQGHAFDEMREILLRAGYATASVDSTVADLRRLVEERDDTARLRGALAFYANDDHYTEPNPIITRDRGYLAQHALSWTK